MDKNSYIEKLLKLGVFPYVIWDEKLGEVKEDEKVPSSVYHFLSTFYQNLNYQKMLEKNAICQVESAVGVCNLLIPGEDRIYVMGPYRKVQVSVAEFFSSVINNNLSVLHELNLFYHSLPIYEEDRMDALRSLLEKEISFVGYEEIQQEKKVPLKDHLHSQFFHWNNAEEAFSVLIAAEGELLTAFYSDNPVLAAEAEQTFIRRVKELDYEFEVRFLREHLSICNCTYQRLCHIKTRLFNEIDSLFYMFQTKIEKVRNLEEAMDLHRKIYENYCGIAAAFSYKDYPYLVQQALRYINVHWRRKITLSEIAEALSVNPSYLSSVFNKATGRKITDYIHQLRTDWAAILLKSTSLNIADISFLCGYEDVSYFGKNYRKIKGETPIQTRMKLHDF